MLDAISPIDGRYHHRTKELSGFFSEAALIRYRVRIELRYLLALKALQLDEVFIRLDADRLNALVNWGENLTKEDIQRVKALEKKTNHDVKAVEYLIKEKLQALRLNELIEFVHFALTSQDINNTAFPLMIQDALKNIYLPSLEVLLTLLKEKSKVYLNAVLLSRTHGQPASPTTMGKEFLVFIERLENEISKLESLIPLKAKFGGATGNFNAHIVSYPGIDWKSFANQFVQSLGLVRSQYTTQIAHYDHLAAVFHSMLRIHTILIDLCRDMWSYISMEYFGQAVVKGEVGSSTMPHKVNPIDFENAEGNFAIANAVLQFLASKLPISRLQRDLTDSTVLRNVGVPFAHALIAFKALEKGLNKIILNERKIKQDLEENWAVVTEGIQTILRREKYPKPYEALKALSRKNKKIDRDTIRNFIHGLDVSDVVKEEMLAITPHNYFGLIP